MEKFAAGASCRGEAKDDEAYPAHRKFRRALFFHDSSRDLDRICLRPTPFSRTRPWTRLEPGGSRLHRPSMLWRPAVRGRCCIPNSRGTAAVARHEPYEKKHARFSIRGIEHLRERFRSVRMQRARNLADAFSAEKGVMRRSASVEFSSVNLGRRSSPNPHAGGAIVASGRNWSSDGTTWLG